jgi:hypothetical protein
MKILIDENLPQQLRLELPGHDVFTFFSSRDWTARDDCGTLQSAMRSGQTRNFSLSVSFIREEEVQVMSLAEVLPDVQALPESDKIRLFQLLAEELKRTCADSIESGKSYPVFSPDREFHAAAALLQALEEDKGQS